MQRAITAIYRTRDVAHLVRDELERLGLSGPHIAVIHKDERGAASSVDDASGDYGAPEGVTPAVSTPGGAFMGVPPGAGLGMSGAMAMPVYREVDLALADALDELHDLHLPEEDTRTFQEAIRNGDYVVSVEVDEDADMARIQEVMRRPEDAHDLDAFETNTRHADYAPRRRPPRGGVTEGMLARRVETQGSPRTREYIREEPLWPRGGA